MANNSIVGSRILIYFLLTLVKSCGANQTSMNKNRLIFYSIFGGFHLFLVIFTFFIESRKDDFNFLFEVLKWISWMKYGAMLGLLFVSVDAVWSWLIHRDSQKEVGALTHELNMLKAKLFDLQEAEKKAAQTPEVKK